MAREPHTEQPRTRLFLSPPLPSKAPTNDQNSTWINSLSSGERDAMGRYRGRRYTEYLLSRALLRHALSESIEPEKPPHTWDIVHIAGSPPVLKSPAALGWHCSLAHSQNRVVIALSNQGRCGVDIEAHRPRKNRSELALSYFTSGEQNLLEQLPEPDRETVFYRLWTLKEAWYKARDRQAFSDILGHLDFSQESDQIAAGDHLQAWWRELDGFSLAFVGRTAPASFQEGWPGQKGTTLPGRLIRFQPLQTRIT